MSKLAKLNSGFLTIENQKGLKGTFSTVGAGVYALTLDGQPLILQPKDEDVYLSSPQFFGKTLGRVAGRIPDKIEVQGETYKLKAGKDHICLHGGELDSLSFKNFKGSVYPHAEANEVKFVYLSPDGENGFPGNLEVRITYTIPHDENELLITQEFRASKETWVSLSNHIYWNVFGDESVDSYRLKINASRYGVFKEGTQLVVDSAPVPECLDFQKGAILKDKLDKIEKEIPAIGTLDHSFLFDSADSTMPQVVLDTPKLTVECYTDYDGTNIYVDSSMTDVEFVNRPGIKRRRAIAIEPQLFPTESKLVSADVAYKHFIRYRIVKK